MIRTTVTAEGGAGEEWPQTNTDESRWEGCHRRGAECAKGRRGGPERMAGRKVLPNVAGSFGTAMAEAIKPG